MQPVLPSHSQRVDPAPKPERTGWIVAGGLLLGFLAVLGPPVVGFLFWLSTGPDPDEPRAAADDFVRHLESNADAAAYQSLCPEIRNRTTAAAFSAAVERMGRPVSHTVGRAAFRNEPGTNAGVTVRLTDRTGRTTTFHWDLDASFGWQICDEDFG
ncbi:hypothetical protein M8C17_04740 [Micromonospora sp. RHAY321]|uniref:Rv0361 family membrane protein n=1 Tax=Micromonospora sp. RHAY321 TaxID=2944807 RepID=UPI00207C2B72|nr:hypothetical protein [Micromonospora sp. RHAY321]MCO1594467.1 hypothetical protein [Micromonospora sp. RHAY321]